MLYTLLFVLTLVLSAFFSCSETAYVAANRLKLRILYYDSEKGLSSQFLLQSDQRFLTTILVGNNIMMVACSSLSVLVFSTFVSRTVLVFFTTAFLLFFGEILPKSIATQIPNRLSRFSLNLLNLFYLVFFPLTRLTEALSQLVVRVLKGERSESKLFSKSDLPVLVREYSATSAFDGDDYLLLARALRFRDKRLWDVMIPRTDVVGVEFGLPLEKVIEVFKSSGFSRLPVYQENLDHVKGFYYILDFFDMPKDMATLLRPCLALPESMRVMEALQKFQKEKASIAITFDEHGGTAGLVTVEDIIERLVGAIEDEFDKGRFRVRKTSDATLIADGRTTVDELSEKLNIELPEGDYVTIAGLIEDRLGRIPQPGESIDLPTCKIKVLEATKTKISKVWVAKKTKKTV